MGKRSNAASSSAPQNGPTGTSSNSTAQNKSSILKSSFAPSTFQLQLFASVIQSFDSQQLRLHDTTSGKLRQQHAVSPGTEITSLDWGYYGSSMRGERSSSKKKRKRNVDSPEDAVLAYGTTTSDVCMYSPAEGRVVNKLSGVHEKGIKDFKFRQDDQREAWSIGGDAKLVQWDLTSGKAVRTILLPDSSTSVLAQPSAQDPRVLCASTQPFSIDPSSDPPQIDSFDAFKHPVHTLLRSAFGHNANAAAFVAADRDRYLNIFDIDQGRLTNTLVAGSEVEHADLYSSVEGGDASQEELLAVVTRDGTVELFPRPFSQTNIANGDLKSKRKSMTKKARAQVKLREPNTKKQVSVFTVSLQGPDLVVVSIHGGVEPSFQRIRWQDEGTGELLLEGVKEVNVVRTVSTINSVTLNGVKEMGKNSVDDSKTVVVNGSGNLDSSQAAIEISSGDEDDGTEGESEAENEVMEEVEDASDSEVEQTDALVRREVSDSDEEMQDTETGVEPSFGEMLAAKHPDTITIGNALVQQHNGEGLAAQQLGVPSGMSLGTVLTQALRSNDNNLLESCLHANDNGIIQNTIQRLDSGLAALLLSKLAERLASRPGRYGHLLSWVQWTCIAHGGAIAGQAEVKTKLKTLYRVLNQRSSSLDQLLLLKGKLDMLEAQLAFRKQLQVQRGTLRDSDEPGMIYIEGEEDNWSSEDDHDEAVGVPKKLGFKTKVPLRKDLSGLVNGDSSSEEDEEEEEEDMPMRNGVVPTDSEEEDESDSEIDSNGRRRKGIVDVEAEVSGEDEDSDSEEGEGDDIDGSEADEDDEDEEEDSSMADFINDGEISEASEEDDIDIDKDDTPRRPATKRSKHR